MRWKLLCRGLVLLLAGVVGCKQTCYMTKDDMDTYKSMDLPAYLEENPCAGAQPVVRRSLEPTTILSPDEPMRFMSLAEAIAIALEQGTVGNQSTVVQNQFGTSLNSIQTSNDQLPGAPNGRGVNGLTPSLSGGGDSIRTFRLDPAIVGAGIEAALSKFDAVWTSSASWNNTDRPIATAQDAIQAGGANIPAIVQQDATVSTGLVKPLPTGGVTAITFSTAYTNTNLPARVNPAYRPSLQFAIEQPLLQGYGVEINQLRANHPGSVLNNLGVFNTTPLGEGILVTRIRFDQSRKEFERNVHLMVLNVELSYWNLYYAYWNLYAQEQALRFAYEAWRISKSKFDAGRIAIAEFAQTRGQYESFRAQRLQALNDVLDLERAFRGMLGMQGADGTRLVPSDQPTLAQYKPDWATAQEEALALRPELEIVRQEVKLAQMDVKIAKDQLLPDLRAGLTYDLNALGNRLDGPDSGTQVNAFRALSSNHFNNYSAQLRLNVPIGFRLAHTQVRVAQLRLARAYATLQDAEQKTISFLEQQFRRVIVAHEVIRANRAAREAFAQQLKAKFDDYIAGRGLPDALLEAQRFWANALSQEYLAIRDYNNSLAIFEAAKGTVLTRNNIVIAEGALPGFAQQRATEHLRERSAALTLRERPSPVALEATATVAGGNPALESTAPSLPNLFNQVPPLKDAPVLPLPDDVGKAPSTTPAVTATAKEQPRALPVSRPSDFGAARPMAPATDGPALLPAMTPTRK